MHYKKITLITVSLALVLSSPLNSVAFADKMVEEKRDVMIAEERIVPVYNTSGNDIKVTDERAIEIAGEVIQDADQYQISLISLNRKSDMKEWSSGGKVWTVIFNPSESAGGNAVVNVDAYTGKIIGLRNSTAFNGYESNVAAITRSEAKKTAEQFLIGQIDDLSSFELSDESPYIYSKKMNGVKERVIYNFNYYKKINGIPLKNHNIYISVDGSTGRITYFHYNEVDIDALKLPSTEDIVTPEQALKKYKDSLDISLQYIKSYEKTPFGLLKPEVILVYAPYTSMNIMDAATGKGLELDGSFIDMTQIQPENLIGNTRPINPEAKLKEKAVNEEEAIFAAEEYKAKVEEAFGVKLDGNGDRGYRKPYYGSEENTWSFSWHKNDGKQNIDFSLSINSKTGHIVNMYINRFDYENEMMMKNAAAASEVSNVVTGWHQGKEKALELIKKLVPDQYGFFADNNLVEPGFSKDNTGYVREYNFSFTRLVNGIRVRDNSMQIEMDSKTGKMTRFVFNWDDLDYPETKGILPKEDAEKKFFEGIGAELIYFLNHSYDYEAEQVKFTDAPRLIYSLTEKRYMYGNAVVDAATGKWVDWSGKEVDMEAFPEVLELPEHWAKRSIELLFAQGIIKDPYVSYDTQLTRIEAVKLMSLAKGLQYYEVNQSLDMPFKDISKDDENYIYLENALKQKILTESGDQFKGDEKITKEEFVKFLVNLIGYTEIAGRNEIYKTEGMKNVSREALGSAAVCHALDILPVKEGEVFDGKAKVTFAEASVALYKALKFIK